MRSAKFVVKGIMVFSLSNFLFACGGSGDKETPDNASKNILPTVSIKNNSEVQQGFSIDLVATATDLDGNIASYNWLQLTELKGISENSDKAVLTFTPTAMQIEPVTFELTVTDNDGAKVTQQATFTIIPTLSLNYVTNKEIYFDNKAEVRACITTTYISTDARETQKQIHLSAGVDKQCFTDDDSNLDEKNSYLRTFNNDTSGLIEYISANKCGYFYIDSTYMQFTTEQGEFESCNGNTPETKSVYDFTINANLQWESALVSHGSSNSVWPGTILNPASIDKLIVYGKYENRYDAETQRFSMYVESVLTDESTPGERDINGLLKVAYVLPTYDDRGNIDYYVRYNLGNDGVINSGDEAIIAVSKNHYNDAGMLDNITDYNSAGSDENWLTFADNNVTAVRYQQFIPVHKLSK